MASRSGPLGSPCGRLTKPPNFASQYLGRGSSCQLIAESYMRFKSLRPVLSRRAASRAALKSRRLGKVTSNILPPLSLWITPRPHSHTAHHCQPHQAVVLCFCGAPRASRLAKAMEISGDCSCRCWRHRIPLTSKPPLGGCSLSAWHPSSRWRWPVPGAGRGHVQRTAQCSPAPPPRMR